ncbi:MAG: hypothetical protein FWG31_04290 [Oscillospiraceae bacterium]|nr:hypothetical protein [Oscillospiraceae bacterium]
MKDMNLPQEAIDEIAVLIAEVIGGWDADTLTSQVVERIRVPGNPVHDFLHHAILISESGLDTETTDTMLEIAQRKVEMEQSPSFPQVAQMTLLRLVIPYIQKRPSMERIAEIFNQLCSWKAFCLVEDTVKKQPR